MTYVALGEGVMVNFRALRSTGEMHDIHFFTAIEPARRTITLARFAQAGEELMLNLVRWSDGTLQGGVHQVVRGLPHAEGLDFAGRMGDANLSATCTPDGGWEVVTNSPAPARLRFVPVGGRRTYPDLDVHLPAADQGYEEQPCHLVADDGRVTGVGLHGYRLGPPTIGNRWQWLSAGTDDGSSAVTLYRAHPPSGVVSRGFMMDGDRFDDVEGLDVLDVSDPGEPFHASGVVQSSRGQLLVEADGDGQVLLASPFPGVRFTVAQYPVRVSVDGRIMYGIFEDTRQA